ncbi:MAG TPA: DUF736 family protein [Rhizomicrobium sp.]|nr:DUF736 family protein [Rhizomicrobium sp.]
MSFVIGTFTPTTDGGWSGSIRTLKIDAKVRFVPNDNRDSEKAPAFRLFVGKSRVGDAWAARTSNENPKDYLRVTFDGPDFSEPFGAALFPSGEGKDAQLVWRRRND